MKKGIGLKNIIKQAKTFFVSFKNRKKCFASFLLVLLSSISLIFAGTTNSSTNGYKCASYFSNIVKNNSDVDNVAMVVEQNGAGAMPDTATEFRGLYGAFGNRITNYAGTVNARKNKSITFVDYPFETNLSFVYIQTGVQVSVSKVNEKHFRAEFYPLDLMFEYYANDPYNFYSFMYLSTGQARQIINYNHPGMFDETIPLSDLSDDPLFIKVCKDELLGNGIVLNFGGEEKTYQVTNIFYEEYYFYETVHDTLGEFVVGYNQYPAGFNKQASYFLNDYEYQNEFYLNYIKEKYVNGNYLFDAYNVHYDGEIDNSLTTSFLKNSSDILSAVFLSASIILVGVAVFMMFRHRLFNLTFCFYFLLSFLFPYFLCAIIWLISKNIIFFPPYFTVALLIYMLILITSFLVIFLVKKYQSDKEVANE